MGRQTNGPGGNEEVVKDLRIDHFELLLLLTVAAVGAHLLCATGLLMVMVVSRCGFVSVEKFAQSSRKTGHTVTAHQFLDGTLRGRRRCRAQATSRSKS